MPVSYTHLDVYKRQDQAVTDGRQDTILDASNLLQSWVSVVLVIGVIVAAFIGALIGKRIVKKHLTV